VSTTLIRFFGRALSCM